MTTKYIIMKSSRAFDGATAPWAYRGPTCASSGVMPGKVYDSKEAAQSDADRLTKHNPAGFVVLEIKNDEMHIQN